MQTIQIDTDNANGNTQVGVNGHFFRIPHGKPVEVTDEQLEVIQNADIPRATVKIIDDGKGGKEPEEAAPAEPIKPTLGTGAPEMRQDPATPAATSAGTDVQQSSKTAEAELEETDPSKELGGDALNAQQVADARAAEAGRLQAEKDAAAAAAAAKPKRAPRGGAAKGTAAKGGKAKGTK